MSNQAQIKLKRMFHPKSDKRPYDLPCRRLYTEYATEINGWDASAGPPEVFRQVLD